MAIRSLYPDRIKIFAFAVAIIFFILVNSAFAAVEFSISLPAATSVTMGDSSVTMPFLVANSAVSTKDIRAVQFSVNTAVYNISAATVLPTGWKIKSIAADSICITNPTGGIAAGTNLLFNITLTGPSGGGITSAAQDITNDALTGTTASSGSASCTPEFTLTNNPAWTRKSLAVDLSATPASVGTGDTITLTMQVTNRSSSAQSGIVASPSWDPPAAVTSSGGPMPANLSLAAGASSTMSWTYRADATGTVTFSASAGNGSATSKTENSNKVVIGNFTAVVSINPLSVISGQDVTVTMVVANNGTSALGNVTPTLSGGGTAARTFLTGPIPANIASLGSGESGTFVWTYDISGTSGQTYYFSGYASSGATNSNTSVSATGTITTYSVTVSPDTVAVGSTNVPIGWTVYNNGSQTIKEVNITYPAGWTYSSANGGGWTVVHTSPTVYFTAGTQIPVGGSKTFYITFSTIPGVTSDTPYTFPVFIKDKTNNTATLNSTVTVTAYVITLAYSPASPIPADGSSKYTLTATLTRGGSPVSGVDLTFTTTAGTLSSPTDTTDANGVATVGLTSPCSTTDINNVIAKAVYLNAEDQKTVAFSAISGGILVYVGGSLKRSDTSGPPDVPSGYGGGFSLDLRNCGTAPLSIQTANSTLSIQAGNLTLSSPLTINSGLTGTLNFTGTVSGTYRCLPILTVNAGAGYTGPFSFYKAPPGDSIDDAITVDSGTTCPSTTGTIPIRFLRWQEVY